MTTWSNLSEQNTTFTSLSGNLGPAITDGNPIGLLLLFTYPLAFGGAVFTNQTRTESTFTNQTIS